MNKKILTCLLLIFIIICASTYTYKIFTTSGIDAVSSYSSSSDEDEDITLHLNVITTDPVRDFEKCSKKIIDCFKNNSFKTIRLSYSSNQHPTYLIATVYRNRKAIDQGEVLFVLYYDSAKDTFEIK